MESRLESALRLAGDSTNFSENFVTFEVAETGTVCCGGTLASATCVGINVARAEPNNTNEVLLRFFVTEESNKESLRRTVGIDTPRPPEVESIPRITAMI
jgi:hypothetical protein